ncbi:MAG: 1-acyl-sn-glycerol-3-phosphate acyltransferase [Deltaproteobacteria bacterium]|nr:1-acyl-sn-glycerol-3-phosphate acyltransferase [Deltaproteobacteria bacterium]
MDFMKDDLWKIRYDDRPFSDDVYEMHALWIKFLHDYYMRVEHIGHSTEAMEVLNKEHSILISNHAITIEALFICYWVLKHGGGHIGTLVFPEAFKVPLIREFFRSCQCVPISIDKGVETLRDRHVLLFPEGMDFIHGILNPTSVPRFHKGFLRMAKQYMKETHRKHVYVVPVAHAGIEESLKFWVIKNETFMESFIRPYVKYPFLIIPKIPLLLPSKVVVNWGMPIRIDLKDLSNERKIAQKNNAFRASLQALKVRAHKIRNMKKF